MAGRKLGKAQPQNVITKVVGRGTGRRLLITIDLSRNVGLSKSGKTILVATSGGNICIDDVPGLKYNLNVMLPLEGK